MKTVTYLDGGTLEYDETIKVGDIIISSCRAGFHRITEIQTLENAVPHFKFETIADANGKPKKAKSECSSYWCRHAKDSLKERIKLLTDLAEKYNVLS